MLTLALLLQAAVAAPAALAPSEIVAAAPASHWIDIAPDDLLVMQLVPDRDGKARRVLIQLMPPPFSQTWIANIRTLAKAHWWDGTSVNRVQDNYVAQWGDATEKKPLPVGMKDTEEKEYSIEIPVAWKADWVAEFEARSKKFEGSASKTAEGQLEAVGAAISLFRDSYAFIVEHRLGWPIAALDRAWPVHCYGMVGVGRGMSPDAGTGAELYTVIGHAPRHLDRNIAVVGRVVEGIEHLSSLPRGTGGLGFYEDPKQRVPVVSIRLASELPQAEQPRMQYLSTESTTFAAYAEARANRRDAFFIVPAGGADICNIPVPTRKAP